MRTKLLHTAILIAPLFTLAVCSGKSSTGPKPDPLEDQPDAPQVDLLHPDGSEILSDEGTIAWNAVDPDSGETERLKVDLDYSANAGSTWSVIDTSRMNGGSYLWDISGLSDGDDYLVRITVTDPTRRSGTDISDSAFTVENRIVLTDRTGKIWDITHAVKVYDMQPENFRFGLGPHAIRPINDPEMVSTGEPGYPEDGAATDVIGTSINGDARAYPVHALTGHEVANDATGGEPISVIY